MIFQEPSPKQIIKATHIFLASLCGILILIAINSSWTTSLRPGLKKTMLYYYDPIDDNLKVEEKKIILSSRNHAYRFATLFEEYQKGPNLAYLKNVFFGETTILHLIYLDEKLTIDMDSNCLNILDEKREKILINSILLTLKRNLPIIEKLRFVNFTFGGKPHHFVKGAFDYSKDFDLNTMELQTNFN